MEVGRDGEVRLVGAGVVGRGVGGEVGCGDWGRVGKLGVGVWGGVGLGGWVEGPRSLWDLSLGLGRSPHISTPGDKAGAEQGPKNH